MRKTPYVLAVLLATVIILTAACSAPAPAAAPTIAPEVPTLGPVATIQPSGGNPADQPTEAGSGSALAPTCQATISCEALDAQQIQLECVKKVPYTNVLIPSGTNYEVVDKSGGYVCNDSGVLVGGKKVISCRGPELMSFELKLTNSACGGGEALAVGTGQCQEGYGYDTAQQCCAPVTTGGASSTNVRVNLGGCPEPNFHNPP